MNIIELNRVKAIRDHIGVLADRMGIDPIEKTKAQNIATFYHANLHDTAHRAIRKGHAYLKHEVRA